jgi:hypothetical protein
MHDTQASKHLVDRLAIALLQHVIENACDAAILARMAMNQCTDFARPVSDQHLVHFSHSLCHLVYLGSDFVRLVKTILDPGGFPSRFQPLGVICVIHIDDFANAEATKVENGQGCRHSAIRNPHGRTNTMRIGSHGVVPQSACRSGHGQLR